MKKIALLIVLIFTSSTVFSSSDHEIVEPYCKAFQEIGGLVMKYRQSNKLASETTTVVLNIINEAQESNDGFKNVSMKIIKKAYKKPIEEEINDKDKIVKEFKNYVYLNCLPMIQEELKK